MSNKHIHAKNLTISLTSLEVGIVRFHVHDIGDAASNNSHISTIQFPDLNNSTQSPVSKIHVI